MMSYHRFRILLSASVPSNKRSEKYQENYTKIKNAQIQIEEAVIGLARNIFQAGGKIIFGGHPSISPLVTMVATEFKLNKEVENMKRNIEQERPVTIFQSKAYQKVIPRETTALFDLGYSNIVWTDAVNKEEYNPGIQDKPQCEESLTSMRRQMIQGKLDALVCIGGMEGVEKEFEIFKELHPSKPIFLLTSTGGASKLLANKFVNNKFVRVIDNGDFKIQIGEYDKEDHNEKFKIIPYSFITALIVKEILDRN